MKTDKTAQMSKLIWVNVVSTCHKTEARVFTSYKKQVYKKQEPVFQYKPHKILYHHI